MEGSAGNRLVKWERLNAHPWQLSLTAVGICVEIEAWQQ